MHKLVTASITLFALLFLLCCPALALEETNSSFSLSQDGFSFMKSFEPFHDTAYCVNEKWYIGYGTSCQEDDFPNGIDEQQAEELLELALLPCIDLVNEFAQKHDLSLKQHEFDALVSLTCSVGSAWMNPSYRFCSYVIDGLDSYEDLAIVDALSVWCHVKSKVDERSLQRRIDEAQLLLSGDYTSGESTPYRYLLLDPTNGSVENDVVCYELDQPYGTLPSAECADYQLEGWYDEQGTLLTTDQLVSDNKTVSAKWTPVPSLTFSDVTISDWFYPYVKDLCKSGVINGYSPERFAPKDTVTYGQALKLILLASSYDKQSPTDTHWASGYLSYAVKEGFLSSSDVKLDDTISRLEIATIAANALKLSAVDISTPFTDTSDPAVLALYDLAILEGSYEGSDLVFKPDDNLTRAEISAIIWRMEQASSTDEPEPTPEPEPEPEPDHTGQIQYNKYWLDILEDVPLNEYNPNLFYRSNGFTLYETTKYRCETGVDVSVYQGNIDWEKVKDSGVDFAIIRVGGRGWGSEGNLFADKHFEKNIEGALAAGLPVGVYFFSQAITEEEALEEANYTLDQIKQYDITYPVVFDWERIGGSETRTYGLSTEKLCSLANLFCQTIEDAGYKPMIYFNSYCGYVKYDLSEIMQYELWFAQYSSTPSFYYNFQMWQYTSSGQVNGIPGKVDLNLYWIKH